MIKSGTHKLFSIVLMVIIGAHTLSAASFDTELHHRILNTSESSGPYISDKFIMLSYAAESGTQVVSLALENEQYRIFHTYEKNRNGIFILTIPIPEGLDEVRYRLVVDGLWTVDPKTEIQRDRRGMQVSSILIPADSSVPAPGIRHLPDGSSRFVYYGNSNSRVSLVGDFNRWDPYLTPMKESAVYPGVYTITLNLPSDARFYRFVVDGQEISDPENHNSSHNGWGETASVIR